MRHYNKEAKQYDTNGCNCSNWHASYARVWINHRANHDRRIDMQTKKYKTLDAISNSMGEYNDCSVKAVAMFCNVRYTEAHRALSILGRKKGRGTTPDRIKTAVNSIMGKTHEWMYPLDAHQKRAGWDNKLGCDAKTPTTFVRKSPVKGGQLVVVNGHIIYMKDGVIHDHDSCNKRRVLMVMNHAE